MVSRLTECAHTTSKSLPLQQLLARQLQKVPQVVECKWHWHAGNVAQHHNTALSYPAGNHCRSLTRVSNTAASNKTHYLPSFSLSFPPWQCWERRKRTLLDFFDLIKYLENATVDLDVFQTELTMAAYRAVMLQLACVSQTCDMLITQTLRELASTHYTRGIYNMHMLDLHYSSRNFMKLTTGLIHWKNHDWSQIQDVSFF